MVITRPFSYNTGAPIAGTIQVGSLAVGTPTSGFTTNPQFWNGPDEELGYVIAVPVSGNTQPTPLFGGNLILNPTYKGGDIVLSNSNQTALQQFGYQQSVLGQTLINNVDKVMFSVQSNVCPGTGNPFFQSIGVGTTSMNYSTQYGAYPGNDTQSVGFSMDGNFYFNGSIVQSGLTTWTSGNTIDVAVNLNSDLIWIRVNGGAWAGNPAGANDPATNQGGLSLNGLTFFYPVLSPGNDVGQMTIQNSAIYGLPEGYQLLGTNITASVGFLGTKNMANPLDESTFVELTNNSFNQNFTTGNDASTWLTNNGYWNSYTGPVLYLDASNPASYPGTGTTWYDISGNGNDVTMVNSNSITWNNSLPVYFSTGANGWFNNPSGSNLPTGNSNYTFIIWVQLGSTWNGNGLMSIGSFGTPNQSNAFRAASTNVLLNYWWANDLVVSTSVSPTNGWFNAVATYDGTTRSIWVNGTLVGSNTPVGHNVITSTLQIAKTADVEFLNGNVGEVFVYDRGLTSVEILSIWNTTKSRYGL